MLKKLTNPAETLPALFMAGSMVAGILSGLSANANAAGATGNGNEAWTYTYSTTAVGGDYGTYIDSVMPATAGNTGKATLNVIGNLPEEPFEVKLWPPAPFNSEGILGQVLKVRRDAVKPHEYSSLSDVAIASFDLTNAVKGAYMITVQKGSDLASLYDAVTVQDGTQPELWVTLDGYTTVRINSQTDYRVWYGNRGNNNNDAALLFLAVPKWTSNGDPVHTLGFNLGDYKTEPYDPSNLTWGTISQQIDSEIDGAHYTVYQLLIKDIAPLSLNPLKVTITWGSNPSDYLLKAWWAGSKPASFHPIWPTN
jgi:hypothetical protein